LAKNEQPRTAPKEHPPPERALPSFDRIYFDTEPLVAAGWPHPSVLLENVASLAKGLNISVHVAEVAYSELEARCLRNYEAMLKDAAAKTSELRSRLKLLGGDPAQIPLVPDVQVEMKHRYLATVEALKQTFLVTPTPQLQTPDLLKMAIAYELAFEEGDKGFRDTVIFLSAAEEVKNSPKPITALFVSRDKVFREKKELLESWAKSKGASVVLCETLEEVEQSLEQRQQAGIRAQIEANRQALEGTLRRHLGDIQDWLEHNVESFKWEETVPVYLGTAPPFTIGSAKVWDLISATPLYGQHPTDGARVRFSFDVNARLLGFAVVQISAALMQRGGLSSFPLRPMLESFDRVLEIEAEATVNEGEYTDFQFLTAKIKQPSMPPMPR